MNEQVIKLGLEVLEAEARAVSEISRAVDDRFVAAVREILACIERGGAVVLTGVGKAGHVARKISATLSSTGTPSHFLSPGDAAHGDLGSIRLGDVVLMLTSSGETDEMIRILSLVKKLGGTAGAAGIKVIAMTASVRSSVGKHADIVLETGKIPEACPLGLAPSASTTAMLALGDALALTVMAQRRFTAEDFAIYHPAGQLGRKLMSVAEAMSFKRGENLPVASDRLTVAGVLHEVSRIKRRSGAVILVDASGRVSGFFTDGDLRRVVTDNDGTALNRPIADVMTRNPMCIRADKLASEAMSLMRKHRFDELPVVDEEDRPVGLIDVQDLVILRMLDVEDR